MKRLFVKPKTLVRVILGLGFAALGFFLTRPLFIKYPVFGASIYGQSFAAGALGTVAALFFPWIGLVIGGWLERIVAKTVARIVYDFWSQQSKRIQEVRRLKQKEKAEKAKEKKIKEAKSPPVILDTSSIIDGRIFDVAKAGFLDGKLVVTQFVLDELQSLADSPNSLKRERGRRGLDLLEEAKKDEKVLLSVKEWALKKDPVDKELIKVARIMEGSVATVDFNLGKVANVSGIKVLNVNELSGALRAVVLPGEKLKIKVIQSGKEAGQGVAYLEDGTMIVLEDGKGLIGQEVEVEVSRILQTVAGKMIFAKRRQS